MNRASQTPRVKIVLLPRNQKQSELLRHDWPAWFERGRTIIPPAAIDGLNLMWHSDLVVSGGGTMNREAAALGVPVFSIFRGTIGAVDRHLSAEGRLVLVESLADVDAKIPIVKRSRKAIAEATSRRTLNQVVDTIHEIAESCTPRALTNRSSSPYQTANHCWRAAELHEGRAADQGHRSSQSRPQQTARQELSGASSTPASTTTRKCRMSFSASLAFRRPTSIWKSDLVPMRFKPRT